MINTLWYDKCMVIARNILPANGQVMPKCKRKPEPELELRNAVSAI